MSGKLFPRCVFLAGVLVTFLGMGEVQGYESGPQVDNSGVRGGRVQSVLVTLRADADTAIDRSSPDLSRGTESSLFIWFDPPFPGGDELLYSLIFFDLASEVPAGAVIESATLGVYLNAIGNTTEMLPVPVSVHPIAGQWYEGVATWSNQPAVGPAGAIAYVNAPAQSWKKWTVTSMVQSWQEGASSNHGFELRGPTTGPGIGMYHLFINSREAGKGPYLDVVYRLLTSHKVSMPLVMM